MIVKSSKRSAHPVGDITSYSCIKWSLLLGLATSLSFTLFIYFRLNTVPELVSVDAVGQLTVTQLADIEKKRNMERNNRAYLLACNSYAEVTFPSGTKVENVVNDDYCDCPSGCDEFRTAACSYVSVGRRIFYCSSSLNSMKNEGDTEENKRMQANFVEPLFASRVNDGVCDCQDCSDEYSGQDRYPALSAIRKNILSGLQHLRKRKEGG
jgi:hypothetical protein